MSYEPALSSSTNPIYKPLDTESAQIRVLYLEPGAQRDQIRGSLITTALSPDDEALGYEAISYCWGNEKIRDVAVLDGLEVDVPASSTEALRGLRREHEARNLWIDAICINQHDTGERGQQVSSMVQVYGRSLKTHIWLGKEDEHTAAAIETMRAIVAAIPPEYIAKPEEVSSLAGMDLDDLAKIALPPGVDISSLASIFSRPWFRRLWVIQEAVVSTSCLGHIGAVEFDWLWIGLVAQSCLVQAGRGDVDFWGLTPYSGTLALHTIMAHWDHLTYGMTLDFLLTTTHNLQTTDPRDKVFGLLALTFWARTRQQVPPGLQPDYTKSVKDCYRDAFRIAIEERFSMDHLLSLLKESTRSGRDNSWPSWVPDLRPYAGGDSPRPFPPGLNSADDTQPMNLPARSSATDDALLVRGMLVGNVEEVLVSAPDEFEQGLRAQPPELLEILSTIEAEDLVRSESDDLLGDPDAYYTLVHTLLLHAFGLRTLESLDTAACEKVFGSVASAKKRITREKALGSAYKRQWLRIPRGFGLGPATMCEGDVVAVLFGSSLPVVLRQVDHWYRLIGLCLLHRQAGVMDGSFVRQKLADGVESEIFEIR